MEERVLRVLVEVVEVLREVRALRGEVAEGRGEDVTRTAWVLVAVVAGLVVGLGKLAQGWRRGRGGRQRGQEGLDEALMEVVTIGRTEEAVAAPPTAGEGDLVQVEVAREGGAPRAEGGEGRGGGRGGDGRREEWWKCLLVSRY